MSLHFHFHLMSVKQTRKPLFKDCSSYEQNWDKTMYEIILLFLKTFIPLVLKKYKVYVFVHGLITVSLVHITYIMYCMIYKMSW